jgi:glycosyltransferase involved in cell wall biosynthesis
VHIAKKSSKESKGILVITHKELSYLSVNIEIRKKNIFRFLFYPVFLIQRIIYNLIMMKLSEKYVVGVHWGWSSVVKTSPDWVSFHMAALGTANILDGKYQVPLNSANFTPKVMRNKHYNKIWDLISVSKSAKGKNIDKLFQSIREIYDSGESIKVILVVASNFKEPNNRHYTNILYDYNRLFSEAERENFVLIKTDPNTGFKGLSTDFLADLMNLSKVFTLFSQVEGESRAIKEAQLCGLPVVVKSDLMGGGRDYLNDKNSKVFEDYSDASKVILDAINCYDKFEISQDEVDDKLSEEESIRKLDLYFETLFKQLGLNYQGNMVNVDFLARRLPGHFNGNDIFWANHKSYQFKTTDIIGPLSFYKFIKRIER